MGDNVAGQLGGGTFTDAHAPLSVASNVVAVAAGAEHSLLLRRTGFLVGDGF